MRLIPKAKPLNYALMWKCADCGKWNKEDSESCMKCARAQPILPAAARPRAQLIHMLDTVIAYCEDNGMNTCATAILRAMIIAYGTQTEGYLADLCRSFIGVHMHYRTDGERLLTFRGAWKENKKR